MEKKHCDNEECKNYWSCKYLKHRFNIDECNDSRQVTINFLHACEIRRRESLLKQLNNRGD